MFAPAGRGDTAIRYTVKLLLVANSTLHGAETTMLAGNFHRAGANAGRAPLHVYGSPHLSRQRMHVYSFTERLPINIKVSPHVCRRGTRHLSSHRWGGRESGGHRSIRQRNFVSGRGQSHRKELCESRGPTQEQGRTKHRQMQSGSDIRVRSELQARWRGGAAAAAAANSYREWPRMARPRPAANPETLALARPEGRNDPKHQ